MTTPLFEDDDLDAGLVWPYLRKRLPHVFRQGPVPGIHKVRAFCYVLRYPKTQQGRRLSQVLDDNEPNIRAKRNLKNLPTAWDDAVRTDHGDRNWKRYRRTQYKTPR